MGSLKAQARSAPVVVVHHVTAGEAVDGIIFVADRDYEIVNVREAHVAAGAASSTLMLEKCASGTAPASGTDLLAAAMALDSTVNTPVNPALTTTKGNRLIKAGEQIAADYTGTVSAYEGVVTIVLQPLHGGVPGY